MTIELTDVLGTVPGVPQSWVTPAESEANRAASLYYYPTVAAVRADPDAATTNPHIVVPIGGLLVLFDWDTEDTTTDTGVDSTPAIQITGVTTGRFLRTEPYVTAQCAAAQIAFAAGSRTLTIYTVPATPTGNGRFILTRCIVRLSTALVGTGNVTFKLGSTSGGEQIISALVINSATSVTVLAGETVASLGSDMLAANAYEAVYNAGQAIYANLVIAGSVTGGVVDVYLYGTFLS